ncbi:hypothetical protein QC762_703140 [Podospora pseudocomata]|uniref:Uncharacterized protein n=1 Tax=Podospora pseudocomata TaxID=2093779 RepID=A0ABR0G2U1_9PEZI|nr:hypothetical protein QC762_703140 [Podospora pseudocomata]
MSTLNRTSSSSLFTRAKGVDCDHSGLFPRFHRAVSLSTYATYQHTRLHLYTVRLRRLKMAPWCPNITSQTFHSRILGTVRYRSPPMLALRRGLDHGELWLCGGGILHGASQ